MNGEMNFTLFSLSPALKAQSRFFRQAGGKLTLLSQSPFTETEGGPGACDEDGGQYHKVSHQQ